MKGARQTKDANDTPRIRVVSKDRTSEEVARRTPRKPPDAWDREARRLISAELMRFGSNATDLLDRLGRLGYDETKAKHLAQRIQRGGFSFAFALRVLRVLGVDRLDISHIPLHKRKRTGGGGR